MEKKKVMIALAVLLALGVNQLGAKSVSSCKALEKAVENGKRNTLALFHDNSDRSVDAKEVYNTLRNRAKDREENIDFVLAPVTGGSMKECADLYGIDVDDEIPLFALFTDRDSSGFSSKESTRESTVVSFVKRNTGINLGRKSKRRRSYSDGYYDDSPRVHIGLGVGGGYHHGRRRRHHGGYWGGRHGGWGHHGYGHGSGVSFGFGF